jgi:hypothetical protein
VGQGHKRLGPQPHPPWGTSTSTAGRRPPRCLRLDGAGHPRGPPRRARTIFADPEHPHLDKFNDQIAWFTGRNDLPALSLRYSRGGHFDFTDVALASRGLTRSQLSWRISDHFPLWLSFRSAISFDRTQEFESR